MFLISVRFRHSRSKTNSDKPGVVFYRISGNASLSEGPKLERDVNSGILGADSKVFLSEKDRIISHIKLIYCIIVERENSGKAFTTDDVVDDFRNALSGSISMTQVIAKSQTDFPIQSDIVSICREFKGDFKVLYAQRECTNKDSVSEYVFNLSQNLKNEKRNCLSRNFLSLMSNIRVYANHEDVYFSNIDTDFINKYADWLKQTGITESTQSFYLRNLRLILNRAHKDGLIEVSPEWFKDVNTRIYKPSNAGSMVLSREVLLRIENLDLSSNRQIELVRDMFMFGFYCEGMELVDIANLMTGNIRNGLLVYRRRQKGLEKAVVLGCQAKKIIKRYRRNGQQHLFPLLEKSGSILFSTVSNYVRQCLKTIGKAVGFPQLTFSMNISAYKALASSVSVSELLLKHGDVV